MEQQEWKKLLDDLNERAKELNCLYRVEEILKNREADPPQVIQRAAAGDSARLAVPPDLPRPRQPRGPEYAAEPFQPTPWLQSAEVRVEGQSVGRIEVFYLEQAPFLPEEQKLLDSIADRFGHFLSRQKLRRAVAEWDSARQGLARGRKKWEIIIELLDRTDRRLSDRIARKMLNFLAWSGIEEARRLLADFSQQRASGPEAGPESNRPSRKTDMSLDDGLRRRIFEVASRHLSGEEIFEQIQKWVRENRVGFLVQALENLDTSLSDISDALSRYHHLAEEDIEFSPYTRKNIAILLTQRLLTEHLELVNVAKDYVDIQDFYDILQRTIFPRNSHGKLGGKSTGLFLASLIVRKAGQGNPDLAGIRVPRTWYITSDTLQRFLSYNDLEEILEQKFKGGEQIREEYPNIVQIFKSSGFPGEIVSWLAACLEDFGDIPDHRAQLGPAGGPGGHRLFGQIQEPVPGQPGRPAGAPGGADGRHRRGVRLGVRPGPHRVPQGTRPGRLPRGDGHPDPGGGGHAGSGATTCRSSRGWPSATTISAGRPASAARTA